MTGKVAELVSDPLSDSRTCVLNQRAYFLPLKNSSDLVKLMTKINLPCTNPEKVIGENGYTYCCFPINPQSCVNIEYYTGIICEYH